MMCGGPVPMDIGGMNTGNQYEQFRLFQEHQHREQMKLQQHQHQQVPQEQTGHAPYIGGVGAEGKGCLPCGEGYVEPYFEGAVGRFT